MIAPIHYRHVHRQAGQSPCGVKAGKASADDHHAWPAGRRPGISSN
jgi:hypothetical protein